MSSVVRDTHALANETTGKHASRAMKIIESFDFSPKIKQEIYDAVLVAKADGTSETDIFAQFVKKYNISPSLKAEIESKMGEFK